MNKYGCSVLMVVMGVCLLCGCERGEYSDDSCAPASDYGVTTPDMSALVIVNEADNIRYQSIKLRGDGWRKEWSDGLQPGQRHVEEIKPGPYRMEVRPYLPGYIYIGAGWTRVHEFDVDPGRAVVFVANDSSFK